MRNDTKEDLMLGDPVWSPVQINTFAQIYTLLIKSLLHLPPMYIKIVV